MLKRGAEDIGNFFNGISNGNTTIALNAAATFLAFSFIPSESLTLTEVRHWLETVTGTVTAANIRCDIYSDNGGTPNVSLANTTASSSTQQTWITFTFSLAVTAGTMYWIVFRNLAGTPASNNYTLKFMDIGMKYNTGTSTNARYGWLKAQSTDSGGTWAGTRAMGVAGNRVKYSDGRVEGFPTSSVAILSTGNLIYAGRKRGVLYTPDIGVALQVTGAMFMVGKNSTTPTGNLQVEIYDVANGNALVATSAVIANANAVASVGSSTITFPFTSPVYLVGGRQYRIVVAETTQSDTSANYFTFYHLVKDTDTGSAVLYVEDGLTYYDGTSWSDTLTQACGYWSLILDSLVRDYAVGNAELRHSVGVR